jgi:hypothetical protein
MLVIARAARAVLIAVKANITHTDVQTATFVERYSGTREEFVRKLNRRCLTC